VLLALAGFALAWPLGAWLRRRRGGCGSRSPRSHRWTTDVTGEHPHEHGEDCGHVAVEHGDHVDYVHDGHRHAPHGEHYDEH
jgi:zinc transport system permease protein